jgi:two-component system, cell cycle sensor histidine kinase and response regulator CckA
VLDASGADEALAICEANHVHLLLTDVVMPGVSGPMLARLLRAQYPNIKVLMMSGYTGTAASDVGIEPPENACFIRKPFAARDLALGVRRTFDENITSG